MCACPCGCNGCVCVCVCAKGVYTVQCTGLSVSGESFLKRAKFYLSLRKRIFSTKLWEYKLFQEKSTVCAYLSAFSFNTEIDCVRNCRTGKLEEK